MSIQDPIANLFSSINNAQARNKEFVKVPSSTKKVALLSMLKEEGYIHSFTTSEGSKLDRSCHMFFGLSDTVLGV